MMLVTESPNLQDSFMKNDFEAGMPLTLSTFFGKPGRGGWIPVFTKYEDGAPIITDWLCPRCNVLVGQSRTCPHCGLEKHEIPIYKDLVRPEREHKSNYKQWILKELRLEDANRISGRRSPGSQPKADPEQRTTEEATGPRREARGTSRY
jgi:hypothetical protein